MARKSGRKLNGWILIDKPAGMSSSSVVGKVRWALDANKAGHAGTLDPDATGLLIIALGEATKLVPFLTDAEKAYDFASNWGAQTNTDDASGEIIESSDMRPPRAALEAALTYFTGDIMQIPPHFSAVKLAGKRAYALARAGECPQLAPRPLHVSSLTLLQHQPDQSLLRMVCGKGGYVRAISRDLGQHLGCFGHTAWLRRIWSGPFAVTSAIPLDLFAARDPGLDAHILPLRAGLTLPSLACPPDQAEALANGNPILAPAHMPDASLICLTYDEEPRAICERRGPMLHPKRVLNL